MSCFRRQTFFANSCSPRSTPSCRAPTAPQRPHSGQVEALGRISRWRGRRGVNDLHRRGVQFRRCRRNDPAALLGRPAVPVGHHAAGRFDDRDQRHDVVVLQADLDDQVDMAGREHGIGIAIGSVARQTDRRLQPVIGDALRPGEQRWRRRAQRRVRQRGGLARRQLSASRPALHTRPCRRWRRTTRR